MGHCWREYCVERINRIQRHPSIFSRIFDISLENVSDVFSPWPAAQVSGVYLASTASLNNAGPENGSFTSSMTALGTRLTGWHFQWGWSGETVAMVVLCLKASARSGDELGRKWQSLLCSCMSVRTESLPLTTYTNYLVEEADFHQCWLCHHSS